MKLRLAPRALAEAKRKKTWWLNNRPDVPDLFEAELRSALHSIVTTPAVGTQYPGRFAVVVRRVLMPKTRNHVYFTVSDDEVVILSVWGARRARGPRL
jgi:plasmid stabilization system protein ParE